MTPANEVLPRLIEKAVQEDIERLCAANAELLIEQCRAVIAKAEEIAQ